MTTYLDGLVSFSVAASETTLRSNSIVIGTSGQEALNFFNGTIDEVRIYNRALTASEISGLGMRAKDFSSLFAKGTGSGGAAASNDLVYQVRWSVGPVERPMDRRLRKVV